MSPMTVAFSQPSYDPCNNYTSLDQPWRATNAIGMNFCDNNFNGNSWYRLFYYGMNIHMPESCVNIFSCGTQIPLWLNGPHPQLGDGVVTRLVCGKSGGDCCYHNSTSIQVKACPGNYYIYKFLTPNFCNAAYCADVNTITQINSTMTVSAQFNLDIIITSSNSTFDPCYNYSVLGDIWRSTSSSYSGHDDTLVEWSGWYRLYLQGSSAQIPEWCVRSSSCGGYTPLMLGGSHPLRQDGIVTRDVYGSYRGRCHFFRSYPVQVKACPGHYYVYKLVRPDLSILMPSYCTVVYSQPSYDPCSNYSSLDQPWRATNSTQLNICDNYFNWNGWYRLLYYGKSIHMPESCTHPFSCGTEVTLWINGSHPQIDDGQVTRQVCGSDQIGCCSSISSIQVKACPDNYYVYEFIKPSFCNAAYCADVNSITPIATVTVPTELSGNSEMLITSSNSTFDPCYNYSVLGDIWRSTSSSYSGHDDTLVEWSGWYRLYLQGSSAQIPEWCVRSSSCGGYTPLMLGGSHPLRQDGIVTRDVYGSNDGQCNYYRSNPVQVKACPGYYYVYRLVKPKNSIPMPTYCTVVLSQPSYDPCISYTSLDEPWRATNATGKNFCDNNFNGNIWYRLLYYRMNIRMAENCVNVFSCGTYYTLWLNGAHPQIDDGVVTRQVCANAGTHCCIFSSTFIQVKACPSNYYVYQFVNPGVCYAAYCADVRTITPRSDPELSTTTLFSANSTGIPTIAVSE
ncbi:uncharacterized protein LOC143490849 [Brachyhypopomus gauderio]|uniref:uncharacterized protein LOC143490849 n=1 Tax=Brachyhypopomus gauderio TaxID=698409 RepID=UPI0040413501